MMLRRSGNQALGVPGAITDLWWPPAGGSAAPCGRVWQTAGAGGCWLHHRSQALVCKHVYFFFVAVCVAVLLSCSSGVQAFSISNPAVQQFWFWTYYWMAGLPIILGFLSHAFLLELACVWVWFY